MDRVQEILKKYFWTIKNNGMNQNIRCYLWGVFCGSVSLAIINYYLKNSLNDSCFDDFTVNPNAERTVDPNYDLYSKIIQSEAAYGDALKHNDKDGMERAFNTSVFYQKQLCPVSK